MLNGLFYMLVILAGVWLSDIVVKLMIHSDKSSRTSLGWQLVALIVMLLIALDVTAFSIASLLGGL